MASNDILLKELELRIDATHEAQRRTRVAFMAVTIVSLAMLIASWNAYLSWDRRYAKMPLPAENTVERHNREEHLSNWKKGTRISVSLLGIDFGVSDAPFLGSITLYVFTLWFFFSIRRENQDIAQLLNDSIEKQFPADLRRLIYHGITSRLVFTTLKRSDDAIKHLPLHPAADKPIPFVRPTFKLLMCLSAVASWLILALAFYSLILTSVLQTNKTSLIEDLLEKDQWPWLAHIVVTTLITVILSTMTSVLCGRVVRFEHATAEILNQYYLEHLGDLRADTGAGVV